MSEAETAEKTQMLKDNGITVVTPSDTLKSEFAEIGQTMSEEWKAKAGDMGAELLDAYGSN